MAREKLLAMRSEQKAPENEFIFLEERFTGEFFKRLKQHLDNGYEMISQPTMNENREHYVYLRRTSAKEVYSND